MRVMHHPPPMLLLFALLLWACPYALAASAPSNTDGATPVSTALSAPLRPLHLAYIESGPNSTFNSTLMALAKGLSEKGLIPKVNVPPELHQQGKALWQWLSQNATGGMVEFLPDGYYSAYWDGDQRAAIKKDVMQRIHGKGDVGLILAMGTNAGLDMVTSDHTIPTFVLNSTDPVQAGISRKPTDSGRDHVFVQILAHREKRQLSLFHKIFQFKKLGVVYEDSLEGRAFAGMGNIEKAAKQNGFALVRCTFVATQDIEERKTHLRSCLKEVAEASDAVYLTFTVTLQGLPINEILQPFIQAEIPTFSQRGVEDTRQGVLMSLSPWDFEEMGGIQAAALLKVIQGAKPRSLKQEFSPRLGLAINLRMAALIDWNIPPEALVAVDELCDQVGGPSGFHPASPHPASSPRSKYVQ